MKENPLIEISKQFAVEIFHLCNRIRDSKKGNVLVNQLLRSGTSIGANIHEAAYAVSRADFLNKMQIAAKEACETDYWLLILQRTGYYDKPFDDIESLLDSVRRMLTATLNTSKNKR